MPIHKPRAAPLSERGRLVCRLGRGLHQLLPKQRPERLSHLPAERSGPYVFAELQDFAHQSAAPRHAPTQASDPVAIPDGYPYTEGALYCLYASPGQVSDIALQPGETLVSVSAGDTVRWVVGDTSSGSGNDTRTHILVKPVASGLTTNLMIATDRRTYHLELTSLETSYMAALSWRQPMSWPF